MPNSPSSKSFEYDDPRRHPEFEKIFVGYLDELNLNGFVDPDRILRDHPELGPAILEDIEIYVQLHSEVEVGAPLGTLGDYTLRRQIGRGGMGVVYEAWQNSLNRRVALKVLPRALAADTRTVTRFVREAQFAGKLDHPNVVHVHGMGLEEQVPYYAMEYVEGETLAQILVRLKDAEPESETVFGQKDGAEYFKSLSRCFADVAEGLQHAHSKGVIHRDIKPSNLILDKEGRLRILDFGLAHLEGQESLTATSGVVGTPLYMSPEQARAKKIPIDHRTDIYSLGATTYEMLTLRPPFKGKDHQDTLSDIIHKDPTEPRRWNPRIPADLETIVLKCLRKDAGDRYGTAEALAQDLRRFARGDPIEARPQATWERLAGRVRRHRTKLLVLLVAAGFLVLASIAAGLYFERREAERHRKLLAYKSELPEVLSSIYECEFGLKVIRGEADWLLGEFASQSSIPLVGVDDFKALRAHAGNDTLERVVARLQEVAAILPERPDAHYHLARAHLLLGRDQDAEKEIQRARKHNSGFVPAKILQLELDGGTREETEAGLERIRTECQEDTGWARRWLEGYQAMRQGNWPGADAAYSQLLELRGQDTEEPYVGCFIDLHLKRGLARLERRELKKAQEDFDAARGRAPGFVEASLLLGKAYYLGGERDGARRIFEDTHDQGSPEEQAERALSVVAIYTGLRDYKGALEWTTGPLADAAASLRGRLEAHCHLWLGETSEAAKLASKVIALDPKDRAAHLVLAAALAVDFCSHEGQDRKTKLPGLLSASRNAQRLNRENLLARDLLDMAEREAKFLQRKAAGPESSPPAPPPPEPARLIQRQGDFGEPTEVVIPGVAWALAPEISADGLELYFRYWEPGKTRGADLWVARRVDPHERFGEAQPLEAINSPFTEADASISGNGLELFFRSNRSDSAVRLYVATRERTMDEDGNLVPFTAPQPLQEFEDWRVSRTNPRLYNPEISASGLDLYFRACSPRYVTSWDIFVATRPTPGLPFGEPRRLACNLQNFDALPSISHDGLTLFWGDASGESRGQDPGCHANDSGWNRNIWMATRDRTRDDHGDWVPFSGRTCLGPPINNELDEMGAAISADWPAPGSEIYFNRYVPNERATTLKVYEARWHPDCNGDGINDLDQIASGDLQDANQNGVPDLCETGGRR